MIHSAIRMQNGKAFVSVDGELYAPFAYTAYFEECARYADFIESGCRMFFVNLSFTDLPINNVTGFTPFETGVFEGERADFTGFDSAVRHILSLCPDALIFPRINLSMPRSWILAHPQETVQTPKGRRESLFSEAFLRDGAALLRQTVSHIRQSDYAHAIAGYQLCGGTTQEWIHHDLAGSFSEKSLAQFFAWRQKKYGESDRVNLQKSDFSTGVFSEACSRYGEFCCEMNANTVAYFARELKSYINGEQIVGVFYGYHAFVNDYLWGLHGMRFLIDSPYIDFFSSPCGYDENRSLGIAWSDMIASASLREHGKLYFAECDIRTHLTRRMQDSRPGKYPDGIYELTDANGNRTAWRGPETLALSLSALYKAFVHHLTRGGGMWWFDMWGGWYADREIMLQLQKMKAVADKAREKAADGFPCAETVLFIDEKAYLNNPHGSDLMHCVNRTHSAMGNTGIPFDLCMTEDAEAVLHRYKAAVFTAPLPSDSGKKALALCEKQGVAYLQPTDNRPSFDTLQLRECLVQAGAHCYNADGNVIYCGNGYIGIHAAEQGAFTITLPSAYTVRAVFDCGFCDAQTDTIRLQMQKNHTAVFELL